MGKLNAMGNPRYYAYLKSPEWQELRGQKLAIAGYRCESCRNRQAGMQCHHIRYRNLHDCTPADLAVLCEDCHHDFHAGCKVLKSKVSTYDSIEKITGVINLWRTKLMLRAKKKPRPTHIRDASRSTIIKHINRTWNDFMKSGYKVEAAKRLLDVLNSYVNCPAEASGPADGIIPTDGMAELPRGGLITLQLVKQFLSKRGCSKAHAIKFGVGWPLRSGWYQSLIRRLKDGECLYFN